MVEETVKKIKSLEIQGARNVAIAAINALEDFSEKYEGKNFVEEFAEKAKLLATSRPTEPMMRNGIRYVLKELEKNKDKGLEELKEIVKKCSESFLEYGERASETIASIGAKRIKHKGIVLVHCHSSTLIKILKEALDSGKIFEVIATETRPLFQGRLTAKELSQYGIPVTLIVDSAVNYFMKDVDQVLVGADAVCANGAVINKVGTSMIALSAKVHNVPLMVAAETFKFDPETIEGDLETIEERSPKEVWEEEVSGVQIKNPAFDATAPEMIDLIITEEGIISPYSAYDIMKKKFEYMFK